MGRRLSSRILIGRASEMAVLEALLAESASGSRFVAISGEAGIGKTRLLATLITLAAERGVPAFVGGCPVVVGGRPIPFAALTQALRSIVRSMDARDLDRTLGSARTELARLLPELGGPGDDPPSQGPRDLGRLFEAVLLLVERAATPNGALLVLEDLHWADPSTWSLVSHLHRSLGSTPLLIAVSYREDDIPAGPGRAALAELVRDAAVERIPLEPLTGDDAHAFLRALPDTQLSDRDIAMIVRRAEGVPFYLEELADQADSQAAAVLPMTVRAAVEVRSARLTPRCRMVVDLVATSDGPVDARLLRTAAGLDQPGLTDALQEAMSSNLLVRAGVRDELVDTRHTLVREALVEALVPGQLPRLHLVHADATETHLDWAGTSDVERWRRFANHLLAAGEHHRAVPALLRTGQAARQALAFQDADEAYQQAFEHLGDSPPPVAGAAWRDVLADAAAVARLAGASDRAVALQEQVVALSDGAHDGHAIERIRLARYHAEAGRPEVAAALLREVAASAAPELRGRCAMELARALLASHDFPGAIEQAELARAAAHEAGDTREEARAAAAMGVALSMVGRHAEALSALTASRHAGLLDDDEPRPTRARPSRLPDSLLRHMDRATILALAGDAEAASRAALEGAETAHRSGVTGPWAAVLAAVAGRELLRLGRWDEAWAALREAVESDPRAASAARVVQAVLAIRRGEMAAGDSALAGISMDDLAATPGTGWVGLHAMAVAELALARATLERARAAVTDGLSRSDGDPDALQRAELAWLGLRIEADGVIQARDRRDPAAAGAGEASAMALLASGHSELAGATVPGLARWVGALRSRLDAEVPRLRGTPDPSAWEVAVGHADGTPDVFGQAYARYRLAEALLDVGAGGRELATRVLQDCLGLARGLGAVPMVEDAQRLAVRARVRVELAANVVSPASTTPRQSARALGLSEREVDVLELLAVGMTDRDIGARLFITEKTAGHHVSHILTKLTVSRRGEAAAVAHRLGVVGPED